MVTVALDVVCVKDNTQEKTTGGGIYVTQCLAGAPVLVSLVPFAGLSKVSSLFDVLLSV